MGIDAQCSGASELPDRAVEVRRGRTAYAYRVVVLALRGTQGANSGAVNWQRKSTQAPSTTKAIPVWIVEEEQRKRSPHSGPCNLRQTDDGRAQQDPCALRVAAEPGPRYRAAGAAAARPRGHLARPPLPPQAAVGGPGRRWRPSTMHTDIACGPPPSDAQRTLVTSGLHGLAVGIWPRGARNAALCTSTTDS